jgi:hypothetical protein
MPRQKPDVSQPTISSERSCSFFCSHGGNLFAKGPPSIPPMQPAKSSHPFTGSPPHADAASLIP